MVNRRARPEAYRSPRDYVAASFASRTMRWTGIIVALFVIFHLLDLTWGAANPDFRTGDPYHNVVESFQRWPVAIAYVIANLARRTSITAPGACSRAWAGSCGGAGRSRSPSPW
jgi:succinate dehydrogenase / fumarate reductase cytochrome b subunit